MVIPMKNPQYIDANVNKMTTKKNILKYMFNKK
jgi:hypothetical protein